jgi:lipoprotein Spr
LPRTAREQALVGEKIVRKDLEFGDLVFFHTYTKKFVSHVGIYLGDDLFAHASSLLGVTISSLNSTYYNNRYVAGRRLSSKDLLTYKISKSAQQELEIDY